MFTKSKMKGIFIEEDIYYPFQPPNHLATFDFSSDDEAESSLALGRSSSEISLNDGHFSQRVSLECARRALEASHCKNQPGSSSGTPRRSSPADEVVQVCRRSRRRRRRTVQRRRKITCKFVRRYRNLRNGREIRGAIKKKNLKYCDDEYSIKEEVESLLLFRILPFRERCNIRLYPKMQRKRTYLEKEDELLYRSLDLLNRIMWSSFRENPFVANFIYECAPNSKYEYYVLTIFLMKLIDYTSKRQDFRQSFNIEEEFPQCDEFYMPIEMTNCLLSVLHTMKALSTNTLEDVCLALSFDFNVPIRMQHIFGLSPRMIFDPTIVYMKFSLDSFRKRQFRLFEIRGPDGIHSDFFTCKYDNNSILGRIRYSQGLMDYMSRQFKIMRESNMSATGTTILGLDTTTFSRCPNYQNFLDRVIRDPHDIFSFWWTAMCSTMKNDLFPSHDFRFNERNPRLDRKSLLKYHCYDVKSGTYKLQVENSRYVTKRMLTNAKRPEIDTGLSSEYWLDIE